MSEKSLKLIADNDVKWVDLRFTDTKGKQQHVTFPASAVNPKFFEGQMFDGSSIAGWKGINESDMVLLPDDSTAVLDPFAEESQINITCDILEPSTMAGYDRDPRSIARRAEEYLKSTGIGDTAYMGPEPEFHIFDDVKYRTTMGYCMSQIISQEAAWSTDKDKDDGNKGHTPRVKGGYFPVPPVDSLHDIRTAMCSTMQDMGLHVEIHHHEVCTAGQCEIGVAFNSLVKKADEVQTLKYVVHNVAAAFGKTATFMPKPIVGDNGNGMHVHQSIFKNGKNMFAGNGYAGLSDDALFYIGGIIKHSKALDGLGNCSTNSYKRLVKGYEAPTMMAYSARNRSASIRIPYIMGGNPKGIRIEVRFGDSTANPYLFFAGMLMAGIDGIKNKIHPGEPASKDLYDLEPEEEAKIPQVADDLLDALRHLDKDRAFLTAGGVFSNDMLDAYIDLKKQDQTLINMTTHPMEFELYYSC